MKKLIPLLIAILYLSVLTGIFIALTTIVVRSSLDSPVYFTGVILAFALSTYILIKD